MGMLILILLVLAGNALVALLKRKHKCRNAGQSEAPARDSFGKIMTVFLGAADALILGFLVLLFCLFEPHWYICLCIVLAGILTEVLLVGLMAQWFTRKRFLAWLACALLLAGGTLGSKRYDRYLRDITVPESFRYQTYAPFRKDSPVCSLEQESTLHFPDLETAPRMDGATALYPVYAAFAQATYPKAMAGMELWDVLKIVSCSTTDTAYRNIVDGKCDVIFVAGPSREQEAYAAEKGVELVYTPIGREAFVFFVHPDNPIDGCTLSQIRSIYAGETTRWSQLGVKGLGKILAYQRSEGSGSQTALQRFVMQDTPLMPAKKEMVAGDMGGIVEQVSSYKNHRNAIGFSFRFYCTALMKDFDVKLLQIDGVAPTPENIENGSYPLSSFFYAVTRSDADENTRMLTAFICGAQGQELVEKSGYTPAGAGA